MMIGDVNTFLWSIEIPLQKRTPPTPHLSLKDKQGFPFAWRGLEPGDREKQWNLHPVLMITGSDSLPLVVSIIVNVDTFAFAIDLHAAVHIGNNTNGHHVLRVDLLRGPGNACL